MRGRLAGRRVHARLGPDLFDLTFELALSPLTDLVTTLSAATARAG